MSQGIFGIIDFNKPIDNPEQLADRMSSFLKKDTRERSKISIEVRDHFILGMKRTSIEPHQQTDIVKSQTTQTHCMIHGEYHNYNDLLQNRADGDLDLALELYEKHGVEFVKKLNGLFCMAILDEREKSFHLFNDRFGMAHQVYWTVVDGRFCFATHLKTLLAYPGIKREIDFEGLNLFLKYSYVLSPWTIFKGIKKLQPGYLLSFKNGNVNIKPYWNFNGPEKRITDQEYAIKEYTRLLQQSIEKRIKASSDYGILLSGGLDSSANVAMAAQVSTNPVKTFAIGFEDPEYDERPYAKIVADHFNTKHSEYTITGDEIEDLPKLVWHLEEPYFEFGFFLTYLGMSSACKEVDVVIGGEGADQMFGTGGFAGGLPVALRHLFTKTHTMCITSFITRRLKNSYFYNNDNLAFKIRLLLNRVIDFNNWYFYGYDEKELFGLYKNPDLVCLPDIFENKLDGNITSFEELYISAQINQDIKHYINENVMVKSGRMADMLNLTLREPFLDVDVYDFLVSIDYNLRRRGTFFDHLKGNYKSKFLHRKAMEGLLPSEIMVKPKQGGFVPVMIFLKSKQLRQRIYHHLLNSEMIKELFNTNFIDDIFQNYESMQGKTIYWHNFYNSKANRILFLLTFEIWYNQYIDNYSVDKQLPSLSDYLA